MAFSLPTGQPQLRRYCPQHFNEPKLYHQRECRGKRRNPKGGHLLTMDRAPLMVEERLLRAMTLVKDFAVNGSRWCVGEVFVAN